MAINKNPAFSINVMAIVGAISIPAIIGADVPAIALAMSTWFVTDYRSGLGAAEMFRLLALKVLKADLEFHAIEILGRRSIKATA